MDHKAARFSVHLLAVLALLLSCSVGAADPDKVLRIAQIDIDTLDPHQWTDTYSNRVGSGIFEALYEWDYLARPTKLVPNTAAGLPEITDGGKKWIIRVTPGIFFTDDPVFNGKPRELVAEDYVYSFKRVLDPNLRRGGAAITTDAIAGARAAVDAARKPGSKFDYDAPIDGLRALDRYTIQIRLVEPNYSIVETQLAAIFAVAREVVAAAGGDIAARPVGTGPYHLKEWKRGSRLLLSANPNYRKITFPESADPERAVLVRSMQGKSLPQIGSIEVSIINEEQPRMFEFDRGNLDYIELAGEAADRLLVNGKLKPEYAARGIEFYELPQSFVRFTYFNLDDPVVGGFGKERIALRRAIALAFDTDSLVRVAYGGWARPLNQLIPPGVTAHDPKVSSKSHYDPAAARALLDRSGYSKLDSERYRLDPDGKQLTVTLVTRPGTLWREWETLWKKNMDAIGLRMKFRELPTQDQLKEMNAGNFQMALRGYGGSPLGFLELAQLQSTQTPLINPSRFKLPEYDRLYAQYLALQTGSAQTLLATQMSEIARTYVPIIPHVVEVGSQFTQPWLQGYFASDFGFYWKYLDIDLARRKLAAR